MDIRNIKIKTKLVKKPVKLLHITDQHITGAYETEDELVKSEAVRREAVFAHIHQLAERCFERLLDIGEKGDFNGVLLSGDIIGYPSKYNIDYLAKKMKEFKKPIAYAIGNHDWCYATEKSCDATRDIHFPEIESAIERSVRMHAIDIAGVTVATFDNTAYRVKPEQTEFLREQIALGKPLIAAFHCPMAVDTIIEPTTKIWKRPSLMNLPREIAEKYNIPHTVADEPTAEFCRLLGESENVIGILAGDVHFNNIGTFGNGKTQVVSAIGVWDFASAVTLVPEEA